MADDRFTTAGIVCDCCPTMFRAEVDCEDPATQRPACPVCGTTSDISHWWDDLSQADWFAELTQSLRGSSGGWWPTLRAQLRERGIEPDISAIADWYPDGTYQYLGVVVTWDGRVVEFDYDYRDDQHLDEGSITRWEEVERESLGFRVHREQIEAALRFLGTPRRS